MTRQRRNLTPVLLAVLLCAASLPFAIPARAETFTVCPSGCDATTIAAALRDADNGDTIAIGEGTYAGGVVVSKDVTLRGAGRDKTTIQGTSAASVIRIGSRADVEIEDVTITGGGGSRNRVNTIAGGGILNEGELTLTDSIVRKNTVASGEGGGVYSHSSKLFTIRGSLIEENQATSGGGVYVRAGEVEMENTTVTGNRSTQTGGGIIYDGGKTLRLERCHITNNRSDFSVGGISADDALEIFDSTVSGNTAVNSTGGLSGGREELTIVRSSISNNVSRGSGGGIRVGSGGVLLLNSTVEKNRTDANGAGIFTTILSGDVELRNSIIIGNTAAQDGGGMLIESQEVELDNSKVIDNQAGRQGGGIYSRTAKKSQVKLSNGSVIAGNQPNQCFPAILRCGTPAS